MIHKKIANNNRNISKYNERSKNGNNYYDYNLWQYYRYDIEKNENFIQYHW